MVVGKDLELRVEVQIQVNEASERSRGVPRWHGLQTIIDLVLVARADAAVEHNRAEPIRHVAMRDEVGRDHRLADSEEVRTQSTDEPLDEDLEDGCGDERVQQADGGVIDVPEAAGSDLHDQEDEEGDEEGHQSSRVDGNDLVAHRVGELGVDDLAVGEADGEAPARRWSRHVHA